MNESHCPHGQQRVGETNDNTADYSQREAKHQYPMKILIGSGYTSMFTQVSDVLCLSSARISRSLIPSEYLNIFLLSFHVNHMYSTRKTRVKTSGDPAYFYRLVKIFYRCAYQSFLYGTLLSVIIPG